MDMRTGSNIHGFGCLGVVVGFRRAAFTLTEVMLAIGLVSVTFISLYTGFTSGFGVVQVARENLRATQILEEKMETIRLYTWTQINSNGFIPTTFTAPFYPNTNANSGLTYTGTVAISPSGLAESYGSNLVRVVVTLGWRSGTSDRSRQMETYVSRFGLQNYIYY